MAQKNILETRSVHGLLHPALALPHAHFYGEIKGLVPKYRPFCVL